TKHLSVIAGYLGAEISCFFIFYYVAPQLHRKIVAAPGSDIILSCSFPLSKNINNLVVNWQRGESEVVHSYYHGRDQLERQSGVYKGRTHLFEDQLIVGNASLRLSGVQPSDQGQYICDVTDEQGSTQDKLQLLVAAPYDEPRISAQATCDGFIVTLHASQGFPQPEVVWKDVMDSNTTMELDSKGLYELKSEVTLRLNSTLTVTGELRLRVLEQICCVMPAEKRSRFVMYPLLLMLLGLVLLLSWKRSEQETKKDKKTQE
uniref:Ig-like domain-containing protein n=1 Tax=Hucho hucho TaxID=62062 RepID=A0A4W5NWB7_9TELE